MASGRKVTKTINYDVRTEADRQKALETALADIEKAFGKGAVMKLGDNANRDNIPIIPTGCMSLDVALGVGGIPRGRIIEIFGPEASGKTTVALHIVAETQKLGGICGYIDAEHALDPAYAKNLGVAIDDLYISQPDDGEQALEIAEHMVRSSVIDLIVVDSVAALTPRAEIEGHMGESHMGLHARLMSQALRKLTAFTNKTSCTIIFINQLRANLSGYGGAETTTGGRALKFYASVRIDIRKHDLLKVGDKFVGARTNAKIAKNKVAPPFRTCSFDLVYGEGISKEGDVLDLAAELGIVVKSGAWYSLDNERMGQGRDNAKAYLVEHPDVFDRLYDEIRKHYNLRKVEALEEVVMPEKEKTTGKAKKGKGKSAKDAVEEETDELQEDDAAENGLEMERVSMEDVYSEEAANGGYDEGFDDGDGGYSEEMLDEMVFEDEP